MNKDPKLHLLVIETDSKVNEEMEKKKKLEIKGLNSNGLLVENWGTKSAAKKLRKSEDASKLFSNPTQGNLQFTSSYTQHIKSGSI